MGPGSVDFEGNDLFVITQFDLIQINTGNLLAIDDLADFIDLIINQGDSFSVDKGSSVEDQFSGFISSSFLGMSGNVGLGGRSGFLYGQEKIFDRL